MKISKGLIYTCTVLEGNALISGGKGARPPLLAPPPGFLRKPVGGGGLILPGLHFSYQRDKYTYMTEFNSIGGQAIEYLSIEGKIKMKQILIGPTQINNC